MTMITLSICVPALNEELSLRASVEDLLTTLSDRVRSLEIIIVDDGSSDATADIADDIARRAPQVTVIHHDKPRGIGVCYHDALRIAQGDYFTWFPADGENLASEFIHCLPHAGPQSVVTCYHTSGGRRPWHRRMLSRIYTVLINAVFGLRMHYYNGLAIFPRRILTGQPLTSSGFFFNAENMIRSVKGAGCSVVELEYPLKNRGAGRSKAMSMRSLRALARDIAAFLKARS